MAYKHGMVTTGSSVWDEENRLVSVTTPAGSEEYEYSGDGQRRKKSTPDGEVLYLWDEENVLEELNAANGLIAHYTDYQDVNTIRCNAFLEDGQSPSLSRVTKITDRM